MLFDKFVGRRFVYFDGAMGSVLMRRGLPRGERPDIMNITAPDDVADVHRAYSAAGSDVLCANTFGANDIALAETGYTVGRIVSAALALARGSADGALVALNIGPLGELISPVGDLTEARAYDLFAAQVTAGEKAGADLVAIETMSDLTEIALAARAVRENSDLAIFATMTFGEDGRTYLGVSPADFARAADGFGAVAIGINCSLAPRRMYGVVRELADNTDLPLIVKPNAGLPDKFGDYDLSPEEFARDMLPYAELGVRVVGGCCGTTPEYIRILRDAFEALG